MSDHTYQVLGAPDNEYTLQSAYVGNATGFVTFMAFFITCYLIVRRFTFGPRAWRRMERLAIAEHLSHSWTAKDLGISDPAALAKHIRDHGAFSD